MKISQATLLNATQQLRYHQKQQEIHAQEEHLRQERMHLERLKYAGKIETDNVRGQNVDIII